MFGISKPIIAERERGQVVMHVTPVSSGLSLMEDNFRLYVNYVYLLNKVQTFYVAL